MDEFDVVTGGQNVETTLNLVVGRSNPQEVEITWLIVIQTAEACMAFRWARRHELWNFKTSWVMLKISHLRDDGEFKGIMCVAFSKVFPANSVSLIWYS